MTEEPVECVSRECARSLAKSTCGKVQGYIPAIGWVDDSMIPEKEERLRSAGRGITGKVVNE